MLSRLKRIVTTLEALGNACLHVAATMRAHIDSYEFSVGHSVPKAKDQGHAN